MTARHRIRPTEKHLDEIELRFRTEHGRCAKNMKIISEPASNCGGGGEMRTNNEAHPDGESELRKMTAKKLSS